MDLMQFVPEQLLILVGCLYVIGMLLKEIKEIKDWTIPLILLGVAILGSIGLQGLSVMAVVQGVICTGVSVLGNQIIKQTTSKRE